MVTKKKVKAKTKKAKKKARTRVTARKPVKKKAASKKTLKAKKPKAKAKPKSAAAPKTATPPVAPAPPPGERVGVVTHYYSHLSVAIIQLETGSLRLGDRIHIKGHTSDFGQTVDSFEIDHAHVDEVRAGQSFGLRGIDHARENDVVYKVTK